MKKTITRMCIACREHRPSEEMFRIAKQECDGCNTEVLDEKQNIQSRGAYVCKDEKCIMLAEKSKAVQRHLKCEPANELFSLMREKI